jgi:hypothetical protein
MSHSEADPSSAAPSPIRPEVLQFQAPASGQGDSETGTETGTVSRQSSPMAHEVRGVSRKVAPFEESKSSAVTGGGGGMIAVQPQPPLEDEILPPPSTPPPPEEDSRW